MKIFDTVRKSDKKAIYIVAENKKQAMEVAIKLSFVKKIDNIKCCIDSTPSFKSSIFDQIEVNKILNGQDIGQAAYQITALKLSDLFSNVNNIPKDKNRLFLCKKISL